MAHTWRIWRGSGKGSGGGGQGGAIHAGASADRSDSDCSTAAGPGRSRRTRELPGVAMAVHRPTPRVSTCWRRVERGEMGGSQGQRREEEQHGRRTAGRGPSSSAAQTGAAAFWLFVGVYAARLMMVWSTCQTACSVTPRTSLGAPRQVQSASHAQILQESSYRERRRKHLHRRWEMEWEWNRPWDGMGMGSLSGWNGNGMGRWSHWPGPVPPIPLSKGRCNRLVPAVAVGGDSTIVRSGLCRARASSPARSSATPPEIALWNVKSAIEQATGWSSRGREACATLQAPGKQPPATAHTTAVTSRHREPRALGRATEETRHTPTRPTPQPDPRTRSPEALLCLAQVGSDGCQQGGV